MIVIIMNTEKKKQLVKLSDFDRSLETPLKHIYIPDIYALILVFISFRYTYVRQARLRNQGNQRLGYKHPGAQRSCSVQADLYGNPPVPEQTRGISTDAG
ncbi:Hypothetical_protein [Hexamita inflata]|uniref:Hypothetical_protein n=1 Tax=Hexamita inflata TaxID=28002 RepID=A0AA86UYN4_9EUKA|nr:Hypothetical protein HINF_LOCUS4661 [Hexamita inflata]CAI9946184.1 Hypothetical protein HINF_LOCUS33829 [Hexamita inflata]CAI9969641.1 Hypothetical protein HINF_LOCUS57286 [Hexamita inflata]